MCLGVCLFLFKHASEKDMIHIKDFGVHHLFNLLVIQTFGWTPQEAKMYMVTDYFSHSEVSNLTNICLNVKQNMRAH